MTLPRLWAFLAIALPFVGALIASLPSTDLAYHLRAGAAILETARIPDVDTWTFTAAGEPWTNQQWGAQVILAAVFQLGGWTGLVLLRALLVAVIFGCLFEIGRRHALPLRTAALLALGAFIVAVVALALRPQLLGMALFAITLLLVTDRHEHPRRLWAIPVLVAVWANVHGSFILGPVVLGLAWLADLESRFEARTARGTEPPAEPSAESRTEPPTEAARPHGTLGVAVVSALAALANPFGPEVWDYAAGLTTNPLVTARITEWQPSSLGDVPGMLFYGSGLLVALLLAGRRRRPPWATILWLAAFFALGVYAARGVAWWSLAAVAALAPLLAASAAARVAPLAARVATRTTSAAPAPPAAPRTTPLLGRVNLAIAGAIVLAGVALLPIWRPIDPGTGAPDRVVGLAPGGITVVLQGITRPGDRLFNPQPWGSWFEFAVPNLPVAIDSRIELFPVEVWDDYDRVRAGRDGWQDVLERWGVTIVVTAASRDAALADRLRAAGWIEQYRDEDGVVFRRGAHPPR